ncbi:unnamed protein product [Auanema sp. JU1783]|nr:unnamed protein product [Auanema sp. JU1783]
MLISEFLPCDSIVPLLEEGDLLEFKRTMYLAGSMTEIYRHWALFIGFTDGVPMVIHISTPDGDFTNVTGFSVKDSMSVLSMFSGGSSAEVRSDSLRGVYGEDTARINNSLDETHRPFPHPIIVKRAMLELGSKNYSIIFNNCEHFVKWCRYGNRISSQAVAVKSFLLSSVLAVGVNPLVAVGVGSLFAATSNAVSRHIHRTFGSTNAFSFF